MRRLTARTFLCALLAMIVCSLPACKQSSAPGSEASTQVRTIDQEHLPESRLRGETAADSTSDPESQSLALPFEPAISMDPVDGSKVSIRRATPTTEYGGRIYHFNSEENLRLFLEDPKKYTTGSMAIY